MPEQQKQMAQNAALQQRATVERLAARHAAYTVDRAKAQEMPDIAVVAHGDQGIGSEHHSIAGVYSLIELSTGNHVAYSGELAYVDKNGKRVLSPYSPLGK
jgi:hypothetical protein